MQHKISTLQDVPAIYTWFQEMRDSQPTWFDKDSGGWHVFRYTDVQTVVTDYAQFSSESRRRAPANPDGAHTAAVDGTAQPARRRGFGASILRMDPPRQRQYRNLVSPSFTPRALSRLKGRIADIAQELLDQIRPLGQTDFVTDFAYPLPTMVIAEMLGVPTSDRPLFKQWADGLLSRQLDDGELLRRSDQSGESPEMKRLMQISDEMSDYFDAMLADRRRQPREDMMTELLASEVDGEHLSLEDTISFCILLLLAGHVTTTNLLSQAVRCFSEHPEAPARLRKQPELMPEAIEEVLRYASPVWRTVRTTKAEVTLEGTTIPANAPVFAWLASANRDERQFPEPERFDIARTPNRHLSFGHGIHFCIGAPLARMEASIALPMLLEQLPDLHVVADQPLPVFQGFGLFGFKNLPVAYTAFEPVRGSR